MQQLHKTFVDKKKTTDKIYFIENIVRLNIKPKNYTSRLKNFYHERCYMAGFDSVYTDFNHREMLQKSLLLAE